MTLAHRTHGTTRKQDNDWPPRCRVATLIYPSAIIFTYILAKKETWFIIFKFKHTQASVLFTASIIYPYYFLSYVTVFYLSFIQFFYILGIIRDLFFPYLFLHNILLYISFLSSYIISLLPYNLYFFFSHPCLFFFSFCSWSANGFSYYLFLKLFFVPARHLGSFTSIQLF